MLRNTFKQNCGEAVDKKHKTELLETPRSTQMQTPVPPLKDFPVKRINHMPNNRNCHHQI